MARAVEGVFTQVAPTYPDIYKERFSCAAGVLPVVHCTAFPVTLKPKCAKYGPAAGLGDGGKQRLRDSSESFGVQLFKCGIILQHILLMFLRVILEMFALCRNVPWSPAVAPKFYVICTVFNDLN